MMEYFSTDKAYVQQRKEICSFCGKAHIQIYYPQLLCPYARMLHIPLDVQVLVQLLGVDRYTCMEKEIHHHHILCKGPL